jgi:hypothetical protein
VRISCIAEKVLEVPTKKKCIKKLKEEQIPKNKFAGNLLATQVTDTCAAPVPQSVVIAQFM